MDVKNLLYYLNKRIFADYIDGREIARYIFLDKSMRRTNFYS